MTYKVKIELNASMNEQKKAKLEAKVWKVGNTEDFLNLDQGKQAYLEIILSLSECLKETRKQKEVTQKELAQMMGSSQSRVAKMEAGDPSVSIDLLVKSLLVLGTTKKDLARIISL